MQTIRQIAKAMSSSNMDTIYKATANKCSNDYLNMFNNKRTNYVGRIVIKTFEHLLEQPNSIKRKHIKPFINTLQLILGDENFNTFQTQCTAIMNSIDTNNSWVEFYQNTEVLLILEKIQIIFAQTFKRFDARKNWFMIVMNNNPNTISISSNGFISSDEHSTKESQDFSEIHFNQIMKALFMNVYPSKITHQYEIEFFKRWNRTPQEVFGPLIVELSK